MYCIHPYPVHLSILVSSRIMVVSNLFITIVILSIMTMMMLLLVMMMMMMVMLVMMVMTVMKVMMMMMMMLRTMVMMAMVMMMMLMMMMMMVSSLQGWHMLRYDEGISALLHLGFRVYRVQVQGLDSVLCDLGCQQSLTRAMPDLYTPQPLGEQPKSLNPKP